MSIEEELVTQAEWVLANLRSLQQLSAEEVGSLVREYESSIVAEFGATGTVGATPPLAFQLERRNKPGKLVELKESDVWKVGLDDSGRIVREGPSTYYSYTPDSTRKILIHSNGRVGACSVLLHPKGLGVHGVVSLATGGVEVNSYGYRYTDGLVSDMYWYKPSRPLHHYMVRRQANGAIDSIEIEGGSVVYRAPKTPLPKLLARAKAALERILDQARRSHEPETPLFAIVLEYSTSGSGALYPPNVWCVPESLRHKVEAGATLAENLWNPLLDQLDLFEGVLEADFRELAAELQNSTEKVVSAYRKWSKLWTKSFPLRTERSDELIVVAIDPEVDAIDDVVAAAVGKRRATKMALTGLF